MKTISLTRGQVAIVDDADYEWLNQWKWIAHLSSNYYASRTDYSSGGKQTVSMHRLIMNAKVGDQVDHIDHGTLNNQRANLRVCTKSQNHMNQRKLSNNTSGIIGVTWDKNAGKWKAEIMCDKKSIYLGLFNDKHEAALTRDAVARRLHGEFATLNFIYKPLSELADTP
jgi:hypothetical protein